MAIDCEIYLLTAVLKHSYLEALPVLSVTQVAKGQHLVYVFFFTHIPARAHQHWEALSGEVLQCDLDNCLHRC